MKLLGLPKFRIYTNFRGVEIYMNGEPLPFVKSYDVKHEPHSAPSITIEFNCEEVVFDGDIVPKVPDSLESF